MTRKRRNGVYNNDNGRDTTMMTTTRTPRIADGDPAEPETTTMEISSLMETLSGKIMTTTTRSEHNEPPTLPVLRHHPSQLPPRTSPPQTFTNVWGINASLLRAYPQGFPPELATEELKVQAEVGGNAASIASFRIATLQQQTLTTFGFLQHKDMTIHIMHSPATYYAQGATGPLKGKDIGFVGDRIEYSTPAPIVLQPVKPWKWVTQRTVISEVAVELFYANPGNANKFFIPLPNDTLEKISIPLLIMLPTAILKYCVNKPQNAFGLAAACHKHDGHHDPIPRHARSFCAPGLRVNSKLVLCSTAQ